MTAKSSLCICQDHSNFFPIQNTFGIHPLDLSKKIHTKDNFLLQANLQYFYQSTYYLNSKGKTPKEILPFLKAPATDTTTTLRSLMSSWRRIWARASFIYNSNVWSSWIWTICMGWPKSWSLFFRTSSLEIFPTLSILT